MPTKSHRWSSETTTWTRSSPARPCAHCTPSSRRSGTTQGRFFSETLRRKLPNDGFRNRLEKPRDDDEGAGLAGFAGSGPEKGTAWSSGPESCPPRSMGPERKSGPEERLESCSGAEEKDEDVWNKEEYCDGMPPAADDEW